MLLSVTGSECTQLVDFKSAKCKSGSIYVCVMSYELQHRQANSIGEVYGDQ
jgi:hypothetical protein